MTEDRAMRAQPTYHVRWRSPLGVTVGLFLFWGALNAFLAIFVPASLHSGGARAPFVYFIPILFEFARFDAPTDGFVFFTAIPIALIVAATVLGWYGLRRERLAVAAA